MVARYDEIAVVYSELMGAYAEDETARALLDMIGNVDGLRVLDVACGHGRVSRELARRGANVTGIDISRRLLDIALDIEESEPMSIRYLCSDVSAGDALEGESFDVVSCNFGLSDIDNLEGALTAVSRVLILNGVFVFSILHPCFPGWDDDAPSAWPPDRGYFSEGWWQARNTGWRGSAGSNFRRLSTILNRLTAHGLAIDHVHEPEPPAEWRERSPGSAPVPYTLVVRCVRR